MKCHFPFISQYCVLALPSEVCCRSTCLQQSLVFFTSLKHAKRHHLAYYQQHVDTNMLQQDTFWHPAGPATRTYTDILHTVDIHWPIDHSDYNIHALAFFYCLLFQLLSNPLTYFIALLCSFTCPPNYVYHIPLAHCITNFLTYLYSKPLVHDITHLLTYFYSFHINHDFTHPLNYFYGIQLTCVITHPLTYMYGIHLSLDISYLLTYFYDIQLSCGITHPLTYMYGIHLRLDISYLLIYFYGIRLSLDTTHLLTYFHGIYLTHCITIVTHCCSHLYNDHFNCCSYLLVYSYICLLTYLYSSIIVAIH